MESTKAREGRVGRVNQGDLMDQEMELEREGKICQNQGIQDA